MTKEERDEVLSAARKKAAKDEKVYQKETSIRSRAIVALAMDLYVQYCRSAAEQGVGETMQEARNCANTAIAHAEAFYQAADERYPQ
jgi:hypothetical protein